VRCGDAGRVRNLFDSPAAGCRWTSASGQVRSVTREQAVAVIGMGGDAPGTRSSAEPVAGAADRGG
jgi:hypothetical protein